jgi:hypothetical protein
VSSYESGNAKVKIEKMLFFTYVTMQSTTDDFKVLSGNFLELANSDAVKHACHMSLGRKINSEAFVSQTHQRNGKHWEKLAGAAKTQRSLRRRAVTVFSWTVWW